LFVIKYNEWKEFVGKKKMKFGGNVGGEKCLLDHKFVTVNDTKISVYVSKEINPEFHTILLLPGFDTPTIYYGYYAFWKPFLKTHNLILYEYPNDGYSGKSTTPRISKNICGELEEVL
jgi:hypothetical protein